VRARYQAGLATLVDVSDAESLLVQAEIDDALARLAVWQNLASVTAAQGDLAPFLQFVHDKTQGVL
jgi:outer membrane protein